MKSDLYKSFSRYMWFEIKFKSHFWKSEKIISRFDHSDQILCSLFAYATFSCHV